MIRQLIGAAAAACLIAACSGPRPLHTADSGRSAVRPAKAGPASGPSIHCLVPPATCYTPRVFLAAYGISPLL